MGFKTGIIGLPNVGKSTLFNALTKTALAQAENFPFCTIEPNVGEVGVPDQRLEILSDIANSKVVVPAKMSFYDIAGLVKGASEGEGLGNQFLANIRECDAIIHVLRCFDDSEIAHVLGSVDPIRDLEIINTELMLADLQSIEKQLLSLEKKANSGDKSVSPLVKLLNKIETSLGAGEYLTIDNFDSDEQLLLKNVQLLTLKPTLYVCNLDENSTQNGNNHSNIVKSYALKQNAVSVNISASIEQEISLIKDRKDQEFFMSELGLEQTGLDKLILEGYKLLGLMTFFTAGPKETRAWTIRTNTTAPKAGRVIHTDFEKGFIRAEVISYDDYVKNAGEQGAKEEGKLRSEGKEYIVKDGDVINFLFNV